MLVHIFQVIFLFGLQPYCYFVSNKYALIDSSHFSHSDCKKYAIKQTLLEEK